MSVEDFHTHLRTAATTVARAWIVTRKDGVVLGFTDHDGDLRVDGVACVADTGLTAQAVHQTSGLSVDNTEASGALSDPRISEVDINAGLYDGAQVRSYLVNWMQPEQRKLTFQGTMGEIRRDGPSFQVELRGLTEALNQPQGRVYQKPCTAVLGDGACGLDTDDPRFHHIGGIDAVVDRQSFAFSNLAQFEEGWFTRGQFKILSGAGLASLGWIKSDTLVDGVRIIELWEPIRAAITDGDQVQLTAGCDKMQSTCARKFDNIANFQGFPFIPGEDWLLSVPKQSGVNDGGSLL